MDDNKLILVEQYLRPNGNDFNGDVKFIIIELIKKNKTKQKKKNNNKKQNKKIKKI